MGFHEAGSLKDLLSSSAQRKIRMIRGPIKENPCMLAHKICNNGKAQIKADFFSMKLFIRHK